MENLTETIIEKRAHNGEAQVREVNREQKFWTAKISWPVIFSGVLVTAVSQMLLSLLGIGIGLSTVDPFRGQNSTEGLGTGTIVWWSVTMLVSLFLGGWATGKMYLPKFKGDLSMHGFMTWATFTVFSFVMLATSVGKLVSGTGNLIGTALTAGAAATKNNPLDISPLTNEARNVILQSPNNRGIGPAAGQQENGTGNMQKTGNSTEPETGKIKNASMSNSKMADAGGQMLLVNVIENFFRTGDMTNAASRESMVNSLVNQTGMSRAEADVKVNQWINTYAEIKARALVKADQVAKVVSTASIIGFFALIIGAFVSVWGARAAQRRNLITVRP
jgi:hypothetical protein